MSSRSHELFNLGLWKSACRLLRYSRHQHMATVLRKSSRVSRSLFLSLSVTAPFFIFSCIYFLKSGTPPSENWDNLKPYAGEPILTAAQLRKSKSLNISKLWKRKLVDRKVLKHDRGIIMSCPLGQSHTHHGNWKPRSMVKGVEAVVKQLDSIGTTMPVYFGYYEREKTMTEPWCKNISAHHSRSIKVICFMIPERFPSKLYGYAKIFAIKHVPVREALWMDCDIFPIRRLEPLFEDLEFQRTGTTFWPDSRDFFDETLFHKLLSRKATDKYPVDAWWVRQGFDTGLILLNREKCAAEIEAVCRVARANHLTTQQQAVRNISMGDKDVFHMLWMLRNKAFTMVPYVGESGNIQTRFRYGYRQGLKRRKLSPQGIGWQMSSQLKYGRDGIIYALHQLHRQHPFALIATLSSGDLFHTPRMTRSKPFVMPLLLGRKDLRAMRRRLPKAEETLSTNFVVDLEALLIRDGKAASANEKELHQVGFHLPPGISVRRGTKLVQQAADRMDSVWSAIARDRFRARRQTGRLTEIDIRDGRFSNKIYRRLQSSLQERNEAEKRRRKTRQDVHGG